MSYFVYRHTICLISHRNLPTFYRKPANFLKMVLKKFGDTNNFRYICSTTISHILGAQETT